MSLTIALLFALPALVLVAGLKLISAGYRLVGRSMVIAAACALALVMTQGDMVMQALQLAFL